MRRPLFFILATICFYIGHSQPGYDSASARRELVQSSEFLFTEKSRAYDLAKKVWFSVQSGNNPYLKAEALMAMAAATRYNISLDLLMDYCANAVKQAYLSADSSLIYTALQSYAQDLLVTNNLPKAFSLLEESKKYEVAATASKKAATKHTRAFYYFKIQNLVKARTLFEESLAAARAINDERLVALNKLRLFLVDVYSGNIDPTAVLAFEALEYFTRMNYAEEIANCRFVIADSYRYAGNLSKAMEMYGEVYSAFKKCNNELAAGMVKSSIFQVALQREELVVAREAVMDIQNHFEKLNYGAGIGVVKNLWGQYYSAAGEFGAADAAFTAADSIATRFNLTSLRTMNLIYRAQHEDRQKKFRSADSTALLAYDAMRTSVSPALVDNSLKKSNGAPGDDVERRMYLDSLFLKTKGADYLRSLRDSTGSLSTVYQPLLSVFDSSVAAAYNRQLAEIETRFGLRASKDSQEAQKQQILLAAAKVRNRNIVLIFSFVLLMLISILLWLQYRSRMRAEKDRRRISKVYKSIHHHVKNNLGVINRVIDVAGKDGAFSNTAFDLKSRVKTIELLHQHLYGEDREPGVISLHRYFTDLCTAIAASFETDKAIRFHIDAPVELESTIAETLGHIVNELVTNSFKYAFTGKSGGNITVRAIRNGNLLDIFVEDDGIGIDEGGKNKGYGMKLIKGLSQELRGKWQFRNAEGTKFQLTVPV